MYSMENAMRLSLLCLGLAALFATSAAQAQIPADLHFQPYPTDYSDLQKNITDPRPPMVDAGKSVPSTQGLTYRRLWVTDFYPFFETYNENKVFQYDPGTNATMIIENSRTFTSGGQLEGGMMAIHSSTDNFASETVNEIYNTPGTVLSMPNFAVTNSEASTVADLMYSVMGFTYPESAGWSRTSQLGIFKTSDDPFDFPMDGPEDGNSVGYQWNYGDAVGVDGDSPSTYLVSQLSNGSGSGQFGAYGVWGFDFAFEDFTANRIPSQWDVNQFRNPGSANSSFNGAPRMGADEEGRLYMVVNNIFADDDQNRVPSFSSSEDQGANWTAFQRMPVSILTNYATTMQWPNIFVYRPYDMEALVVTGINQFSYFYRVGSSNDQGNLVNLDLVEAAYNNGSWTLTRVAELNGIPLTFQRQDSISDLQGQFAWIPRYDVSSLGHEIDAARAADGTGIIVKWIDESPDQGYVKFASPLTAWFFSQQNSQWAETQFDSLLTTDAFFSIKPTGQGWTAPTNLTNDLDYDHGTRIPPVVPSVAPLNIPYMSLKTFTVAEYNPQYPYLAAIAAMPSLILDASTDYRTPNHVQYSQISATTSVEEQTQNYTFAFNAVAPNPASNEAEVTFTMDVHGMVSVEIYSTTGNKVANVYSGSLPAGLHGVMVDASAMASGTYYVALTIDGQRLTQPLVIIK